jgi:alkylation response protein AidB-like acyl-CoA dehydrogenase
MRYTRRCSADRGRAKSAAAKTRDARQQIAAARSRRDLEVLGLRGMTDGLQGRLNPHLSAAMKLYGTSLAQRFSTAMLELYGPYGQLYAEHAQAPTAPAVARRWLGDRAQTIAGGTSEIQKNIVAERILGLPRG